jgi:hypothetical protein
MTMKKTIGYYSPLIFVFLIGYAIYVLIPDNPKILVDNFTDGNVELYIDNEFIGEFPNWSKGEIKRVNKNYFKIKKGNHSVKVIDKKTNSLLNYENRYFKRDAIYLFNIGQRVTYDMNTITYTSRYSSPARNTKIGSLKKDFIFKFSKTNDHNFYKRPEDFPKKISVKGEFGSIRQRYFYRYKID